VEFAKELQEQGVELKRGDPAGRASAPASDPDDVDRLRPRRAAAGISSGAGSGSQNAIGVGVLGGMLSATFLGIFFVPVFFVLVRGFFSKKAVIPASVGVQS
jgi:multidrug efflux pump